MGSCWCQQENTENFERVSYYNFILYFFGRQIVLLEFGMFVVFEKHELL